MTFVCPGCQKPEPREWCWDNRTDCPLALPLRWPMPASPEQWHPVFWLSQNKTVVHKAGCPLAYGGAPWEWSDPQPMLACRLIAAHRGLAKCQYCEPFR